MLLHAIRHYGTRGERFFCANERAPAEFTAPHALFYLNVGKRGAPVCSVYTVPDKIVPAFWLNNSSLAVNLADG